MSKVLQHAVLRKRKMSYAKRQKLGVEFIRGRFLRVAFVYGISIQLYMPRMTEFRPNVRLCTTVFWARHRHVLDVRHVVSEPCE